MGVRKRSYLAMLLSLSFPGLGQVFLRRPLKGFVLFLGVAVAAFIIYSNSYPVKTWHDLICFSDAKEAGFDRMHKEPEATVLDATQLEKEEMAVELWRFESGKKLMYRPSWKLKLSGFVQGVIFWLYAIFDAWRGQRGFNRRAFKKRLNEAKNRRKLKNQERQIR